jgi:hypothetical protein
MKAFFKLFNIVKNYLIRQRGLDNKLGFNNHFFIEHWREGKLLGKYAVPNDIVNEGKNKILDVMFNGATQIANNSWFIGLINNAGYSAVAAGDTMSSHAGWAEATGYNEATRVAWGSGSAASQQVTNGTAATFTINATATLKGVFVVTNSTKGGTTGVLWATALFASTVSVDSGDQLKITYTVAT